MDSTASHLVLLKTSGDYNKFKELLRSRLYECGWVDQIHMLCRQSRRNSNSSTNELFSEVARKGRGLVPASVKRELLLRVKENLLQSAGYYDDEVKK